MAARRRHFPFRLTGGKRWVSIFEKDAMPLGDMILGTKEVYGWPVEIGGGELELAAMAGERWHVPARQRR